MANRHFRLRGHNAEVAGPSETSSDSDSESEVVVTAHGKETALRQDEEEVESKDETGSCTSSSEEDRDGSSEEDSDDSSDEDGVVQLHRPIFLKNLNSAKKPDENDVQKIREERESKKRLTLIQKVEHENRVVVAQEEARSQIDTNYSTDRALMKSAMMLDDNDAIDPNHEKQEWLKRQESRKKERRDKLVAVQLELEEYEANKLKFSKDDKAITIDEVSEQGSTTRVKIDKSKQYRPSRLKETQFANLENRSRDNNITEYSIL